MKLIIQLMISEHDDSSGADLVMILLAWLYKQMINVIMNHYWIDHEGTRETPARHEANTSGRKTQHSKLKQSQLECAPHGMKETQAAGNHNKTNPEHRDPEAQQHPKTKPKNHNPETTHKKS